MVLLSHFYEFLAWGIYLSVLFLFSCTIFNTQRNLSSNERILLGSFLANIFIIFGGLIEILYLNIGGFLPIALAILFSLSINWKENKHLILNAFSISIPKELCGGIILLFLICFVKIQIPAYHLDSLRYHIPTAALLISQKSIFLNSANLMIGANPILGEIPKAWSYLLVKNDSLVSLQQIPYLIGILSIFLCLCEKYKVKSKFLLLLIIISVPKFFDQSFSGNIDVFLAFWISSSIYFVIFKKNYAWISLAIIPHAKYTSYLSSFLLSGIHFFRAKKNKIFVLGLFVFIVFFPAWLIKNQLQYKNPIEPYYYLTKSPSLLDFKVKEKTRLFLEDTPENRSYYAYLLNTVDGYKANSGKTPSSIQVIFPFKYILSWLDYYSISYDLYTARSGILFWSLLIPSFFFLGVILFIRKKPSRLKFIFFSVFIFYIFTPRSWEIRMSFYILPFMTFCAAYLIQKVNFSLQKKVWAIFLCLGLAINILQIAYSNPQQIELLKHILHLPLEDRTSLNVISYTTQGTVTNEYLELGRAFEKCTTLEKNKNIWIDYPYKLQYSPNWYKAMTYLFFPKDWNKKIFIGDINIEQKRFIEANLDLIILFKGSDQNYVNEKRYKRIFSNDEGSVYEKIL